MSAPVEDLSRLYEAHHARARAGGEFVYVPERIPFFLRALHPPGKRILDLGCRAGAVTQHYLPGNAVVGVDVDRVALAVAKRRGIEPVLADAEAPLPFEDGSFDAVVAGELLEHVRSPEQVVGEARRVLRRGGTFVGSVPNAFNVQSRLRFLRGVPPDPDPTHLHMFSPEALARVLAGFERLELAFLGGRFMRVNRRRFAWAVAFSGTRR